LDRSVVAQPVEMLVRAGEDLLEDVLIAAGSRNSCFVSSYCPLERAIRRHAEASAERCARRKRTP